MAAASPWQDAATQPIARRRADRQKDRNEADHEEDEPQAVVGTRDDNDAPRAEVGKRRPPVARPLVGVRVAAEVDLVDRPKAVVAVGAVVVADLAGHAVIAA